VAGAVDRVLLLLGQALNLGDCLHDLL